MTREQAIEKFAQNKLKNGGFVIDAYKQYIINAIYDDFDHIAEILDKANEEEISRHFNEIERLTKQHEEELKKAYIEGGNDVWKALNCKELAK